mgnify:FL=1
MKTDTYIVTLESGCYEWTRENEIHGYKAAKEAGIREAQRCGKDIFYLVRCSQWWPYTGGIAREIVEGLEIDFRNDINDYETLKNVPESEIKELELGINKLFRQWLIRNNRIPNGVYFDDEIIYKVVNGKAVKLGKAI